MKRLLPLLALLLLLPCLGAAKPLSRPVKVIATFTILGDLAKQVGGTEVQVYSLVGNNATAGDYKPTETDRISVERSDLVVSNGLGLEGWLGDLLQRSKEQVRVIQASKGVRPRYAAGGGLDPHAWMDVANAMIYVQNIRDGLIAADPLNAQYYKDNADGLLYQLKKLDHWVKLQIGRLPDYRRAFVLSHDSMAYFAAAYGLGILPIEGIEIDPRASASDYPEVIAKMKKNHLDLIFSENVGSKNVVMEMALLTGAREAGKLYASALSDDDGAGNYMDLIRTDVNTIYNTLAPPKASAPAK